MSIDRPSQFVGTRFWCNRNRYSFDEGSTYFCVLGPQFFPSSSQGKLTVVKVPVIMQGCNIEDGEDDDEFTQFHYVDEDKDAYPKRSQNPYIPEFSTTILQKVCLKIGFHRLLPSRISI